jgi:hypothetical protein
VFHSVYKIIPIFFAIKEKYITFSVKIKYFIIYFLKNMFPVEHFYKFEFAGVIDFGILRHISTAPSPRELPNASEAEGVFC